MTAAVLHVRARISLGDGTLADRSFTVDPADTATPWFDVLAGLVDIGRDARDAYRADLILAGER